MTRRSVPRQSRMGIRLVCDLCGISREAGHCRPFTLVANIRGDSGQRSTRSFGSLDLCDTCWRERAARNRREGNDHDPFDL